MKTIGKKFLTSLLIILLMFNFIYGNYLPVLAAEAVQFDDVVSLLSNLLGGAVGIFSYVPRLIAMALGLVVNVLTAQIAYMDDTTVDSTVSNTAVITPFNIFFNDVQLLDVNFLDLDINENSTTYVIRQQVAQWYYIMRLLAAAILLVILIFVGIKMAITSVAEEKAIYKKTLVDWATSLALVFLLQFIIMFTLNANSAIVKAMKTVVDTTGVDSTIMGIALRSLGISWQACGATVVYCIFVFQTLAFVFTYIKRMLTVGFLIIISPLISITYSIDRMGDGKAQALNTWLKEFIYGVLIQPFHCVMYMAFLDTAFNLLKTPSANDLSNAILAILCMRFIDDGEKIVRKIFGFEGASSVSPIATAAAAGVVMNGGKMAVNAANTVRKGINMSKQSGLLSAINKDKSARLDKKAEKMAKSTAVKDGKSWENMGDEERKTAISNAKDTLETQKKNTPIRKLSEKLNASRNEKRENAINKNMLARFGGEEGLEKFRNSATNEEWEAARNEAAKPYDDKKASQKERRQKIKGAVGKVTTPVGNAFGKAKEVYGKAMNTNVGRYIRTTGIRKMTSAGVGLALGGMALGASNVGALTAMSAGISTYQGVDTFRATSTKTLAKQSSEYLDGRVSNKEECKDHIERVKANGDNGAYNGNSEEVKELIKNLKEILMGMGYSSGDATERVRNIQNKINYQAGSDPKNLDVNRILQSEIGEKAKNAEVQDAAKNYANHTLDANLYSLMQKGADMQMSTDEFIKHMNNTVQFAPQAVTPPSRDSENAPINSDEPREGSGGGSGSEGKVTPPHTDSDTPGDGSGDGSGTGSPDEVDVRVSKILEEVITVENYEEIINKVDQADVNRILSAIDERIAVLNQQADGIASADPKLEKLNQEFSRLDEFKKQLIQPKETPTPPSPKND